MVPDASLWRNRSRLGYIPGTAGMRGYNVPHLQGSRIRDARPLWAIRNPCRVM